MIGVIAVSCSRDRIITIEKGNLRVDFYSAMPVFKNIIYSSDTVSPQIGRGLTVNGELKEWSQWEIKSRMKGDTVVYEMNLNHPEIKADFLFWIDSASVRMRITNIEDKSGLIQISTLSSKLVTRALVP